MSELPRMADLQEADYGRDRDYAYGSPHLTHDRINKDIRDRLTAVVHDVSSRFGECRALEIGAGHGTFTDVLLAAGASVTVTEMSAPSVAVLEERYADEPRVTVVHDPDGDLGPELIRSGASNLVSCISVLHHIPDYTAAVARLVESLPPGGGFFAAQDPTFYPRRSRWHHYADRGAYFVWRLRQGNLTRGLKTRVRRVRGIYDPADVSDMVEYHVVRQGVDEQRLSSMLREHFESVELWTYWSTQGAALQRIGERLCIPSTFGLTATARRDAAE